MIDTNASRFTAGTLAVIYLETSDLSGYEPSAVPEPATWALMLIGFAGLGVAGYRGSRKSAASVKRSASPLQTLAERRSPHERRFCHSLSRKAMRAGPRSSPVAGRRPCA